MCRGGAGPELAAVVTGMSSIQRWVCSLVNGHVFSCFPLPEVKRAIMYQALYRKYRPKTFDDVVGQEHITETLKKQVETGRLSHAYLFIGTRGTGKTTCAKILAKAVNCEHPVNGNPCNQCAACRGIDDGSILDVVEIDAASNNRVEDVRALRDEAVFSPANVNKRVYIIDEVHMLSNSAFNALLKILEEPPAHLMFILATTELHKVPATILSRCQRHSFKRIPVDTIAARLNYVAQQERLDLQPDAAALLARMADGGMRDALTLLDQCSGSDVITTEAVISAMGLAGNLRTARLLQSIADGDTAKTLEQFRSLWQDGKDPAALLDELSMLQRDLLMQAVAPRGGRELLSGGYDSETLRSLSGAFTSAQLLANLQSIQDALTAMAAQLNPRIAAELCLIRLCRPELCDDVPTLCARVDKLEQAVRSGDIPAPTAAAPAKPAPAPQLEPVPKSSPAQAAQPKPEPKPVFDDAPRGSRPHRLSPCRRQNRSQNRCMTTCPRGSRPHRLSPCRRQNRSQNRCMTTCPRGAAPGASGFTGGAAALGNAAGTETGTASHAQSRAHTRATRASRSGTGTGNGPGTRTRAGACPRAHRRVRLAGTVRVYGA